MLNTKPQVFIGDRKAELRLRLAAKKAGSQRMPEYLQDARIELQRQEVVSRLIEKVRKL
jgi:hypothetical protein